LSAGRPTGDSQHDVVALAPLLRRVIGARVRDGQVVEDLVQETLTRVMATRQRLEPRTLAPYAVVTARNLTRSLASSQDRSRRHAHRLIDLREPVLPEEEALRREERRAITTALAKLSRHDQEALVAHEVEGLDTTTLAATRDSTPGAVAAQLSRARARLRVEYLLELEQAEPPTARCRPVLLALSAGDRRRQRDLDAGGMEAPMAPLATSNRKLTSAARRPPGSGAGPVGTSAAPGGPDPPCRSAWPRVRSAGRRR
jgi:RNA polymerase sigma factor (sigma-70 family)